MGAYFKLKSDFVLKRLSFGTLQCRLLQTIQLKLNNGEFTQLGLARLTGISQPQVHNLLKGVRRLSPESADVFLEALHLSVLDLITEADVSPTVNVAPGEVALPGIPLLRKPPISASLEEQLSFSAYPSDDHHRENPASSLKGRLGVTKHAS